MITHELRSGNVAATSISADSNYPAAATAAVITKAAVAGRRWLIHNIQWSYSAAPTGGKLTITDGGTTIFDIDITAAGPGSVDLTLKGSLNSAVVITLASGAGAVVGKLQAQVENHPE